MLPAEQADHLRQAQECLLQRGPLTVGLQPSGTLGLGWLMSWTAQASTLQQQYFFQVMLFGRF